MFVLLLSILFTAAWNHFVFCLLFAVTRWYLLLLFVYTYCLLPFAAWSFALCSCFLLFADVWCIICYDLPVSAADCFYLFTAISYNVLLFATICCVYNNFMLFAAFCFAATWCYLLLFAALFCCCCCCCCCC